MENGGFFAKFWRRDLAKCLSGRKKDVHPLDSPSV